jgi:hypothetical protein
MTTTHTRETPDDLHPCNTVNICTLMTQKNTRRHSADHTPFNRTINDERPPLRPQGQCRLTAGTATARIWSPNPAPD